MKFINRILIGIVYLAIFSMLLYTLILLISNLFLFQEASLGVFKPSIKVSTILTMILFLISSVPVILIFIKRNYVQISVLIFYMVFTVAGIYLEYLVAQNALSISLSSITFEKFLEFKETSLTSFIIKQLIGIILVYLYLFKIPSVNNHFSKKR